MVISINHYVSADIPVEDIRHFYSVFEKINDKLKNSEEEFEKIEKGFKI